MDKTQLTKMLSKRRFIFKCILFTCFLLLFGKSFPLAPTEEGKLVFLESCNCAKVYSLLPAGTEGGPEPESFCSKESALYGPHQQVISYSLFKSNQTEEYSKWGAKDVEKGLMENLRTMREHFPGWILRVYSNLQENGFICGLRCNNSDFFWCDIKNIPKYGDLSELDYRTWRFLPLGDPTVDVFLSRDLDNILSSRDAAAVKDWLENTTKAFHVFRDRSVHNAPVMGGLWGGRNDLLSPKIAGRLHETLLNQSSLPRRNIKGFDQGFLTDWIYLSNRHQFVSYDAYNCEFFGNETLTRPFSTQRNGSEFLGRPTLWNETFEPEECPESCRPEHGKSWIYC